MLLMEQYLCLSYPISAVLLGIVTEVVAKTSTLLNMPNGTFLSKDVSGSPMNADTMYNSSAV